MNVDCKRTNFEAAAGRNSHWHFYFEDPQCKQNSSVANRLHADRLLRNNKAAHPDLKESSNFVCGGMLRFPGALPLAHLRGSNKWCNN